MNELNTPLVTVGMTTYNSPETFRKALECIVNQTYKNLEIIISDDCSPGEDTKNIIREFEQRDTRIKYIRQQTQLGAPENIKFVLTQATGEYFMWADDDDLRDIRWIEVLLQNMLNEDAVASLGKVIVIELGGNQIRECKHLQYSGSRLGRLIKYFMEEGYDGKSCVVCGLFKTEFVQKIKFWGDYIPKEFGADMLFVFDCLQRGNVIADQSVAIYKRVPHGRGRGEETLKLAIKSALNVSRLRHFISYSSVALNPIDKTILLALVPLKIFKYYLLGAARVMGNQYRGVYRRDVR